MEFVGGELFYYLKDRLEIDMNVSLNIFQQLVYGIEHCHKNFFCHRNIKLENLYYIFSSGFY